MCLNLGTHNHQKKKTRIFKVNIVSAEFAFKSKPSHFKSNEIK